MKKRLNQFRKLFPNHWLSVLSLLVSLVAVSLAFQASRMAEESIKLTQETYEFAKQRKFDIWGTTHNQVVSVNSCFDSERNLYVLKYQTQNTIVFTNLGGSSASLIASGFSDGRHAYDVKREVEQNTQAGTLGPVDMFPGSSQELSFVATYRSSKDQEYATKEKAQAALLGLKPIEGAHWQFHFSDGNVYRVELKSLWFASESEAYNSDFSIKCETLEP